MAVSTPCYCTREDVKNALDLAETGRSNVLIDNAIEAAARSIEDLTNRKFYPEDLTKKFDWPNYQRARPWRLWLNQNDLISLTSVTSGGVSIPIGQVFLEPVNGSSSVSPSPYTYLELDLSTSASFTVGPTFQRSIAITGTWGYSAVTASASTLAAAVNSSSSTTITISDGSQVGVGDLLVIDSERLLVQDRAPVSTGTTNMLGATTAMVSDATIMTDTTQFHVGDVILIESERMLVTDVNAGLNEITVKRAWDGTVLAAHSSLLSIYAYRLLTVLRGQLGTTAATHSNAAPVSRYVYPGMIRELAIAEAENTFLQKTSGYSRTVGEGDNLRFASGAGLEDIRRRVQAAYGRKARQRAI